jgi:hypothetical protein
VTGPVLTGETIAVLERLAKGDQADDGVRAWARDAWTAAGGQTASPAEVVRACRDLVRARVQFLPDPASVELIVAPRHLVRQPAPAGDCDCQATLLASMLLALGMEPAFTRVAWSAGTGPDPWDHVLVRVDRAGGPTYADSTTDSDPAMLVRGAAAVAEGRPISRPEVVAGWPECRVLRLEGQMLSCLTGTCVPGATLGRPLTAEDLARLGALTAEDLAGGQGLGAATPGPTVDASRFCQKMIPGSSLPAKAARAACNRWAQGRDVAGICDQLPAELAEYRDPCREAVAELAAGVAPQVPAAQVWPGADARDMAALREAVQYRVIIGRSLYPERAAVFGYAQDADPEIVTGAMLAAGTRLAAYLWGLTPSGFRIFLAAKSTDITRAQIASSSGVEPVDGDYVLSATLTCRSFAWAERLKADAGPHVDRLTLNGGSDWPCAPKGSQLPGGQAAAPLSVEVPAVRREAAPSGGGLGPLVAAGLAILAASQG